VQHVAGALGDEHVGAVDHQVRRMGRLAAEIAARRCAASPSSTSRATTELPRTPGVEEGEAHAVGDGHRLAVRSSEALDVPTTSSSRAARHFRALARVLPVQEASVGDLDRGRVAEHDGAEVAGGGGGVDGALVAELDEHREGARVVDVGVGETTADSLTGIGSRELRSWASRRLPW
jgi:hypothetical protein